MLKTAASLEHLYYKSLIVLMLMVNNITSSSDHDRKCGFGSAIHLNLRSNINYCIMNFVTLLYSHTVIYNE